MARTQQQRKAETRERLLAAAAELFAREGYDAVAIDWREHAACQGIDAEIFYPVEDEDAEPAKAVSLISETSTATAGALRALIAGRSMRFMAASWRIEPVAGHS